MPVIFKEFISFYTLLFSIINVATVISCVFRLFYADCKDKQRCRICVVFRLSASERRFCAFAIVISIINYVARVIKAKTCAKSVRTGGA